MPVTKAHGGFSGFASLGVEDVGADEDEDFGGLMVCGFIIMLKSFILMCLQSVIKASTNKGKKDKKKKEQAQKGGGKKAAPSTTSTQTTSRKPATRAQRTAAKKKNSIDEKDDDGDNEDEDMEVIDDSEPKVKKTVTVE